MPDITELDPHARHILQLVAREEAVSRSQLAAAMGIAPSTVGIRVASLLAEGLLQEVGTEPSQGGRPARKLILNDDAGRLFTVDLGGGHARIGRHSMSGELLDATLWAADPLPWFAGGTTLVVRRIEMDLDFWDRTTRERQELVIGRRLDNGAPLTGQHETDALDLIATDTDGRPVIPPDAHARRSHPDENGSRRIVRRGINYTHTDLVDGRPVTSAGLVFQSFQANIAQQFVPIQNRLDAGDALNDWTHAIGSAVFAIPGGFPEGDWIARALFE